MVLAPLEFSECAADRPSFREKLSRHERQMERTAAQLKRLVREVKDVVSAARRLSAAQLALAASMEQLQFDGGGTAPDLEHPAHLTHPAHPTDDELATRRALQHFAKLIRTVEEERERMLGNAHEQIILPLEKFRKDHIGAVKEGKKKFDKKTAKFCQTQERTLSLSTKKPDNVFQEADAALDMAERDLCQASLEYVFLLRAVQERRKFELVETLLGFVFGWWTFYHQAHEVHLEGQAVARDLQLRIQRTRDAFELASKDSELHMKRMMETRHANKEEELCGAGGARGGYVYQQERKAFGSAWSRSYASFTPRGRRLTLTGPGGSAGDMALTVRAARSLSEPERRFCWEVIPAEAEKPPLVLQALSEQDRACWVRCINEAVSDPAGDVPPPAPPSPPAALDEAGFTFVRRCIAFIETRGLEDQGLYRVAGVSSKASRLARCARSPSRLSEALQAPDLETRTVTSALKIYLRALPDPLLSSHLHHAFIAAAKLESRAERVSSLQTLVGALPGPHRDMLVLIVRHLRNVMQQSDKNLMSAANLAVCFGPTLLRPAHDSVSSILELKFCNVVVELLLEHADCILVPPHPAHTAHTIYNGLGSSSRCLSQYAPHQQLALRQLCSPGPGPAPAPTLLPPPPPPPPPPHAALSASSESVSSGSGRSTPGGLSAGGLRVRTLYACLGEGEGELSFEPNMIISNVVPSGEPGWLRGTLRGRAGLVPENYVEPLP